MTVDKILSGSRLLLSSLPVLPVTYYRPYEQHQQITVNFIKKQNQRTCTHDGSAAI